MKLTIEMLQELYKLDAVFLTQHVIERCKQRDIRPRQIRAAVMNGNIIEEYPDDFPLSSCLILGYPDIDIPLHVVMASDGRQAKVVTAYYPDKDKWEQNMRIRKEK